MGKRAGRTSTTLPRSASRGRPTALSGGVLDGAAWRGHPGDKSLAALGDVALGICIQRRQPYALAEAYRRHGGALYAATTRVCGPARAEAVVAEVLVELWWQPQLFDPEASSLRAYLLGQAHSRAVTVVHAGGARTSPPGAAAYLDHDVDGHGAQALSSLPEAEQAVIALAYLGGYRCSEIAEALDEPEAVVAARMRSGLRRLAGHPLAREARR